MKKILTLLTGGTIGSESNKGIIGLKKEGSLLVDLYLKKGRKDVSIDVVRLENILSENAAVGDLAKIVNTLAYIDNLEYSGVIIAYGTDTLAYAAGFTAMALPEYPISVVFVASDKPLDQEGANGLINFGGAVDFICDNGLNGVFAAYQNPGESTRIHLGSRLLQADAITGRFSSVAGLFFGVTENGKFIYNSVLGNPQIKEIQKKSNREGVKELENASPYVLYIKCSPNSEFRIYHIEKHKPAAVVVELYHSGTGPIGTERSLETFIKNCLGQRIQVVLACYPYQDGRKYTTTITLEEAGGIFVYRTSAEAAYAKALVYFMRERTISLAEYMAKDLFFETIN